MDAPLSLDFVRTWLRDLFAAAVVRQAAEMAARERLAMLTTAAEQTRASAQEHADTQYADIVQAAEVEYQSQRQALVAQGEKRLAILERAYRQAKHQRTEQFEQADQKLKGTYEQARWAVTSRTDGALGRNTARAQKRRHTIAKHLESVQKHSKAGQALLHGWGIPKKLPPRPQRPKVDRPAMPLAKRLIKTRRQTLSLERRLRKWKLPILTRGYVAVPIIVVLAFLGAVIGGPPPVNYAVAGTLAFAGVGTWLSLRWLLRQQGLVEAQKLFLLRRRAKRLTKTCNTVVQAAHDFTKVHVEDHRARATVRVEAKFPPSLLAQKRHYEADVAKIDHTHRPKLIEATSQQAKAVKQFDADYATAQATRAAEYAALTHAITTTHADTMANVQAEYDAAFAALAQTWANAVTLGQARLNGVQESNAAYFPPWDAGRDHIPANSPSGMRFGDLTIDLDAAPDLQPHSTGLVRFEPSVPVVPATLPFSHRCAMLIRTQEKGRSEATNLLQALLMRFLWTLPPGKVRLTLIDPVGLGEHFAGFMHLADHDPNLVTDRIWTETQHIERRLMDLTQHMETVLQKYLRNRYATIDAYNAEAGEVAEPFRVVVIANFPTGFTPDAARRLLNLVTSGPSCGVCPLISVDTRLPLPQGFKLADLETACVTLAWRDQRFVLKDTDLGDYPLTVDAPPPAEMLTKLLNTVGTNAVAAARVEVSFDFVAPQPQTWWKSSSQSGLDVPLGRAGATKRQHMRLGSGTAQHVLVAGKTGSGKSTLLHVLITNAALLYPPDELELYLIDFKKGVEFKAYATQGLPHARVVAIESEREFGLSVLQRLDTELKRRGELFRQLGVADIPGYRSSAQGPNQCPRVMLIVDEFQEFFIEDDRTSQEAALLLDRLVRQGRAFGLHVILGSQTLGGAYSLARSTIDQMAVRIALQCSEADAGLILSKDNTAARLLGRPGEALYNAAGGQVEGNDPFQVVWLPDERRDEYARTLAARAVAEGMHVAPPIVFEGATPADAANNVALTACLAQAPVPSSLERAWLGDAVAIKDPTAALFRAQGGSNLLLIGAHPEAALGVLTTAAIGVAAHRPTHPTPRIFVLDGTPPDSTFAHVWPDVVAALGPQAQLSPRRELGTVLGTLLAEVTQRQATDVPTVPMYLILNGLQTFRELRKGDDDFGFGRRGEEKVSPAKQFATLLRDGPSAHVHVLVWCDSLTNLQRALDRQALRDFEQRILFPMSAADSSTLIDSPAANKLGVHRALFVSEDLGQPEKFRPYGVPAVEWLAQVRATLAVEPVSTG